ncbi:MAG: thiamine-monophosphate kinase [Planctomycetes bacterium]|nr:thiamine-monophosphate kinase [Planctomycetota bacterium]
MKEFDFIHWICGQSSFDPAAVPVGPGDDMAVVTLGDERLLVTVDQVLDGVHVSLAQHGPQAAGRKAMLRNLSDVAAMAARPVAAVASVALPKGMGEADARGIYRGLRALGDEFGCPLVGGDVSTWTQPLAISVTVLARPAGATGGVRPVLRSGARAGNVICVTGELGGAWLTGRHLRARPRVQEAIVLGLRYRLRAMIDISDGLAADLGRLCEASGCGAELDAEAIPVAADAAAGRHVEPLQAALHDGEDYELLFTMPAAQARQLCNDSNAPLTVTRIGRCIKEPGLWLLDAAGQRQPLEPRGWEHAT